jgi:hypothetical protein
LRVGGVNGIFGGEWPVPPDMADEFYWFGNHTNENDQCIINNTIIKEWIFLQAS